MSTTIIAEIGVNHDGSLNKAIELVDAAVAAGADVVKLQTFSACRLATPSAPKAKYQQWVDGQNQIELLRALELTAEDHRQLVEHCRKREVEFLSTGFDEEKVDFLVSLGVRRLKVPSGEINNLPYLLHIGAKGLPILLSSGMATLGEIEAAIGVLESAGSQRQNITILHCTTEYPAPMAEVNLRAMNSIGLAFGVSVGYSDHTLGSEVPIAAVALGAVVIEKHLTLDKSARGPDHAASMEPRDFSEMVSAIRHVEDAIGDGLKMPTESEAKNRPLVRRSLVASTPIRAGEFFSARNLAAKRPGTGISPMMWDEIIGRPASRDYEIDEQIEW